MSQFKLGYARVSTLQQDEALQHDALLAAGCQRVFVDRPAASWSHGRLWMTSWSKPVRVTLSWSGVLIDSGAASAT